MKTYNYKTDGESGSVEARTLQAALRAVICEAGVSRAAVADGAWAWVEDPRTGERIYYHQENMG